MRLIPRHRHHHRTRPLRVSISEAEIAADLLYPASPKPVRQRAAGSARRSAR
jgi:hypothetical protein